MNVPVVFMQRSDVYPGRSQEYVRVALEQAEHYDQRVVLLGDDGNKDFGAEHHDVYDYFEGASWLAEHYIHMSTNPAPFEIAATQCAFVLREFMLRENIEVAALCETDAMLYCCMGDVAESLGDFDAAYSIPWNQPDYRWSASFHASIWTQEGVDRLCQIIRHGYSTEEGLARIRSKRDFHRRERQAGGVCIMTFLWFLAQEGVVNLSVVRDGTVFDHNIRVSENYGLEDFQMEDVDGYPRPIKRVTWANGEPYGWYSRLPGGQHDELVKFNALHFNSSSKVLMSAYRTGEDDRHD